MRPKFEIQYGVHEHYQTNNDIKERNRVLCEKLSVILCLDYA